MSDGRALSENDIRACEGSAYAGHFLKYKPFSTNTTDAGEDVLDLIATIRDRDKRIAEQTKEIERLSTLTLHELIADSKGINMKIGGASGKAFMAALVKFFEDNGGKNFLAMTVEMDGFKYQIEIRNLNGELSAAEKLDHIEQHNNILVKALEEITKTLDYAPDVGLHNGPEARKIAREALAKVQAIPREQSKGTEGSG